MSKIEGGYYIKARCYKNSWIAKAAPVVREVWDYLLREANHKATKYNGFIIDRGQLFRSFSEIIEDLSWKSGYRTNRYSGNQMKHTMKLLRVHRMIELTGHPRGNLITILNYSKYQDPKNYESSSESSNESSNGHPMVIRQSLSINKNVKNEKNETIPDSVESGEEYFYLTKKKRKLTGKRLESFEKFWSAFNYKKDRASAADSWLDIPLLTDKLVEKICSAASHEANNRKEKILKGTTPIYAQGWLTGRRWEDEIETCEISKPKIKTIAEREQEEKELFANRKMS